LTGITLTPAISAIASSLYCNEYTQKAAFQVIEKFGGELLPT
jgi:hypothetical protein